MSKFDKPFCEIVCRVFAPEGSQLFKDLLETAAYQQGVKDTLLKHSGRNTRVRLAKATNKNAALARDVKS